MTTVVILHNLGDNDKKSLHVFNIDALFLFMLASRIILRWARLPKTGKLGDSDEAPRLSFKNGPII
jgi:hypothetical protein